MMVFFSDGEGGRVEVEIHRIFRAVANQARGHVIIPDSSSEKMSFYFETVCAKAQCGTKSRTKCVLVFGQIFDSREVSSRNITICRNYYHENSV